MDTHDQPPGSNGHSHGAHEHEPNPRGRAFFWGGIAAGVVLVLLLFTHGFGLFRPRPAAAAPPALVHQGGRIFVPERSPLRQRLTVEPAPAEDKSAIVSAPGIVEADPTRIIKVLPPGAGRVREVPVNVGSRVQRGELLALIDSPDLAQAYSDNDKARSAALLARKNLNYQEAQLKIGAASQSAVDQARDADTEAAAEYQRSREHLRAMGGAEEARGEARLLAIRSPVAGSITQLAIAPGATINDDTQSVMTLQDLSCVWVTAMVAEKDVAYVAAGQDAQVTLEAYPGQTLHGKVLSVTDQIEPDTRREKTRIAFENPQLLLRPNMFATVTLHGPALRRVVLPSSALLMNNDRTTVFVATAPWTFERRTVEPLLSEGRSVTLSSGLQPGEPVVVRGGILLND
jgi:membrane fusion protein, heavy metal efflux system